MTFSEYFKWLKRDWAKAGLILSIFLFVFLFVFVWPQDRVLFVLLIQTPLYMLHETEEYVFPGGFQKFLNTKIIRSGREDAPIDENFIFYVNTAFIWFLLPLFGLLSTIDYGYGLWIPYFSLIAGLAHIGLGIIGKQLYNPGLGVSLALNIPVSLWSISFLMDQGLLNNFFLNPHMVIGLAANALLPILIVIAWRNYKKEQGM